jgi:hypothetical protein
MSQHGRDAVTAAALLALGGTLSWMLSATGAHGEWLRWLTATDAVHAGTLHQPLALLALRTPVSAIEHIAPSLGAGAVARAELAVAAAVWTSLLFVAVRLAGCRVSDAAVLSATAILTAVTPWFSQPGRPAFASLSVLPALVVAAAAARGTRSTGGTALAVAASASMAPANAFIGVLAAARVHPWRHALQCAAYGLAIVFLCYGAQQFIYPSSGTLIAGAAAGSVEAGVRLSPISAVGVVLWLALVAMGLAAGGPGAVLRRFLVPAILLQAAVAMMWLRQRDVALASAFPMLVGLASLGAQTPRRPLVLALAAGAAIVAASGNLGLL